MCTFRSPVRSTVSFPTGFRMSLQMVTLILK